MTTVRRQTALLDGDGWQIRPHLGLEAALSAARHSGAGREAGASDDGAAIHAVHTAADAAAGWLPARVPGSVLDDLIRAGEVEDPYVERNSRAVEWVPERAWTYRRSFEIPPLADGERAWLRFDGIDHAGHVFLDGVEIALHAGTFVPLEVALVDRAVRAGRHELAVVVEPAPPSEPQVGRTSLVRVHKPRMSYGWDFCPRLVHQGLWQSVSLITAGAVRIADIRARPILAEDLQSATVNILVSLDVADGWVGHVHLAASLGEGAVPRATAEQPVGAGERAADLVLHVDRPPLWWPNGDGEPALHRLMVRAFVDDEIVDERELEVGFRRIERRPNEGARSEARPWTFVVNGRLIEIRGWNWTPIDALYGVPRPDRLDHLLRLAVASHANLLRIWGGGLIETDAFYRACDRLGILVWQEFSQSSSGIDNAPSTDPAFVELMAREAEAIVPLRRNHPSLAVWCGGNELQDEAGRPLEDERSPVLRALRDVVRRLDPDRVWLPTSPSGPRFHNRLLDIEADPDGLEDVHGPWEHQGLRDQHRLWDAGTSLFNGEFGVEGMTNGRSHERLIRPEHRSPADRSNPVYRHLGDWWNNAELVAEAFGGGIEDLETLRRASQWLQAEGLRYAIEANRRRWPRNTGSVVWQLNESFPNAWCTSVVDHRGEPKPAWYAARRAFAPALVCARFPAPVLDGTGHVAARVVAWAAGWSAASAIVRTRVVGLDGTVSDESVREVDLHGRTPVVVEEDDLGVPERLGPLVLLDLLLEGSPAPKVAPLATNRYVLAAGTNLAALRHLPTARLDIDRTTDGGDWCLRIRHVDGAAAIGVNVADDRPIAEPGWAEIEDSGFSLLPGESRNVRVAWPNAPGRDRHVAVDAWNVDRMVVR